VLDPLELDDPVELPDPVGGVPLAALDPLGPAPCVHPPAMLDGGLPAYSLSMALDPFVVTVLKATLSPTAKALNVVLPFFSMSLELVTEYVAVPLLVLMVTLDAPTAVTVPCKGRVTPGGAPGP